MSTNLELTVAQLLDRVTQLEADDGASPARLARAVDSGGDVFPVVIVSYDAQKNEFLAQRVQYKSSPPVTGDIELVGDTFQVYPPPGHDPANLNQTGVVFTGTLTSVTALHVIPLLGTTNPQGDVEVYLPLKPFPSAAFLDYAATQVISEGNG